MSGVTMLRSSLFILWLAVIGLFLVVKSSLFLEASLGARDDVTVTYYEQLATDLITTLEKALSETA